jgi:small subunit ribosomal protein S20
MANTLSAKKRVRQAVRKTEVNKARRSRIRTFIKRVEDFLLKGDSDGASKALKDAQPEIQRGVSKGVLHKNTAGRKISRLATRIKSMNT